MHHYRRIIRPLSTLVGRRIVTTTTTKRSCSTRSVHAIDVETGTVLDGTLHFKRMWSDSSIVDFSSSSDVVDDDVTRLLDNEDSINGEECFDLFKRSDTESKIRIGYLWYLRRLDHKDPGFMKGIVEYLVQRGKENDPQDLVVLCLMIYFCRRRWSLEELLEMVDPTHLQRRLTDSISRINDRDLCAVLQTFNKYDLSINNSRLRALLYSRLMTMSSSSFSTTNATEFAIINVVVALNKDKFIFKDEKRDIETVLRSCDYTNLSLRSVIKVMSLGIARDLTYEPGAEIVLRRLEMENLESLSLRELVGVLYYYVGQRLSTTFNLFSKISNEISKLRDENCSLRDVEDLVQCRIFLAQSGLRIDPHFLELLYESVHEIPEDLSNLSVSSKIVEGSLAENAFRRIFPESFKRSKIQVESDIEQYDGRKLRFLIPYLYTWCRIESGLWTEDSPLMSQLRLRNQIRLDFRTSSTSSLSHKQFIQKTTYHSLKRFFQDSNSVRLTHILPHYQEPDLIFGLLCGNMIKVPKYLYQETGQIKSVPKIGDWFVVLCVPTRDVEAERIAETIDQLLTPHDRFKKRQLERLGYKILVVSSLDLKKYTARNGLELAEMISKWAFDSN